MKEGRKLTSLKWYIRGTFNLRYLFFFSYYPKVASDTQNIYKQSINIDQLEGAWVVCHCTCSLLTWLDFL